MNLSGPINCNKTTKFRYKYDFIDLYKGRVPKKKKVIFIAGGGGGGGQRGLFTTFFFGLKMIFKQF